MTHNTQISPSICIQAPDAIAEHLLKPRLPVLKERYPRLSVRLNPKIMPIHPATIFLGAEDLGHQNLLSRSVGYFSSHIYCDRPNTARGTVPELIERFDPTRARPIDGTSAETSELWMSFDPNLQHLAGMRQTLDWVESCVTTLAWLNDNPQLQPPLSKADTLR